MAELRWPFSEVAAALHGGLARMDAELALEQAVRGLDAKDEVELHPVLREGLVEHGYGAHAEERYPSDRGHRKRSAGRRCDLVVTPRSLALDAGTGKQPDLFELPGGCPLDEALWIEVKTVAQFCERGPNRAYASALTRPVWKDVEKLASDPGIALRAVLVVLFTGDPMVAEHDLETWAALGRRRGLLLAEPVVHHLPLQDRYGNTLCTTALFPVGGLAYS